MTKDQFWSIIEEVHRASHGDMDKKCDLLRDRLSKLDAGGIRDFRAHFDECDRRAFDWGLWGAAYIIHGGCGDDSFSDFRSTLISHGREIFERALVDPDSLADLPLTEETACYEGYAYVVTEPEEKISRESAPSGTPFPSEPSGKAWDEDDDKMLAQRFPRLHSKHGRSLPRSGGGTAEKKPWWRIW